MTRFAGAVLAAGAGTRMGGPKAELLVDGRRLLDRAADALREGGCDPVLAVLRPGVPAPPLVQPIVNRAPEQGMRSSLRLAVEACAASAPSTDPAAGADAVLAVLLVDVPGVGPAAVRSVLTAWRPGRIAVADFGGRRGHPIAMAISLWREAIDLAGPDEGARRLLAARQELVDEIAVVGDPADLDHPSQLARWAARAPAPWHDGR